MQPVLIDTDILSQFLRNHPHVSRRVAEYLAVHERLNFSIITFYEVVSGLKHRDAYRQLSVFLELASESDILPLDQTSATRAADAYAQLRKQGEPIEDMDLLIAGTALAHSLNLVTHNVDHFKRIPGLVVIDWTQQKVG